MSLLEAISPTARALFRKQRARKLFIQQFIGVTLFMALMVVIYILAA